MKARNIGCSRNIAFVLLIVTFLWVPDSHADIGGGSGKPITPYPRGSLVTEQQVREMLDRASAQMAVADVRIGGANASKSGYKVGMAYVRDGKLTGTVQFVFSGVDNQNLKSQIPFGNATAFHLVRVEKKLIGNDEAVIEVTEFPDLTPSELLVEKPSYTMLLKNHTRVVQLKVSLQDGSGELCMVGTDWYSDNEYHVLFRIRDMEPGAEVKLRPNLVDGSGLWWAIDSVVQDKEYPYRKFMKR